jgi:hypothetical protein
LNLLAVFELSLAVANEFVPAVSATGHKRFIGVYPIFIREVHDITSSSDDLNFPHPL